MILDPYFIDLLRQHLPHLPPGQPLDPERALRDFGLDSMEMVALLIDLEDGYGVQLPDDDLITTTFRTASTLWQVLQSVRAGSDSDAARIG